MDQFERVTDPADPRRCQAVIPSKGQCDLVAMEGCACCVNHGGANQTRCNEEKSKNIYRASKWRASIERHANHDKIKSLREEIGILRMMIDERMAICQSEVDLVIASGPLSDLIMKVEKLVSSCDRIETKLGQTLDQNQAVQFAQEIIEIVSGQVGDVPNKDDILENVSNEITKALSRLTTVGGDTTPAR